ncbi:MAG: hypothetical protein QOF71_2836 [Candidatus Eremiobacteraeota bacterium]|nr:hypothetical protein [Candidatus Eremiobacteraeota bacterium]
MLREPQQSASIIQHRRTFDRQRDAATSAYEQFDADVVLETFDDAAQRRLRHHEAFGGAPKVQLFGDDDERAEPPKFWERGSRGDSLGSGQENVVCSAS